MRIIHINTEPWDSGLTEYSLVLAKTQQDLGHEVLYLARQHKYPLQKALTMGIKAESYSSGLNLSFKLRDLLIEFKPDIVNAHTGSSHSAAAMALGTTHLKTKLVRTRADARPLQQKPFSLLLWKKTNGFIAASTPIKADFDSFIKRKLSSLETTTILQGIANTPKDIVPLPGQEPFKIGMLARLDPVKGHIYALQAMQQIIKEKPAAQLHIAGENKNISKDYLRAAAKELGIPKNNVVFHGRLNNIYDLINSCNIGLIASTGSEAISRAALEWFSAGRPLVSTKVGGLSDIIENGINGLLIPPKNAKAIAEAVLKFADDENFCRTAAKKAAVTFRQNFTDKIFAQKTIAFYKELL